MVSNKIQVQRWYYLVMEEFDEKWVDTETFDCNVGIFPNLSTVWDIVEICNSRENTCEFHSCELILFSEVTSEEHGTSCFVIHAMTLLSCGGEIY